MNPFLPAAQLGGTVSAGPVSGWRELAEGLMAYYGVDPAQHPAVVHVLELAIGEELLDLGRDVLAEHGVLPTEESTGPAPQWPKHRPTTYLPPGSPFTETCRECDRAWPCPAERGRLAFLVEKSSQAGGAP